MSFHDFCNAIESPALKAVALHWGAARGARPMPAWEDIQPSQIAAQLALVWAFRYDRETREFTGRLASNRITQGFGISFRGQPLRELHPPETFPTVHRYMSRIVLEPALYRSGGQLFKRRERVVGGERIMLPLSTNGMDGDGVLGASHYELPLTDLERTPVELISEQEDWFAVTDAPCPA